MSFNKKEEKPSIFKFLFRNSFFVLLLSLFVFLPPIAVKAVDGIMNGKTVTGLTDNYLFWLQTYDPDTAPYFFDKFFINKEGNVGIGTTAPGAKLSVSSSGANGIEIEQDTATAVNSGRLFFTSSEGSFVIMNEGNDLSFRSGAAVGSSSGSEKMVLTSTGNVGIGTTNPTNKLDVSGTFRNTLSTTHSLLGGAGNAVVMSDNTGTLYSTGLDTFLSSNTLWSGTRNGNIWNGDAGVGNVGIGTTNPDTLLDVVGEKNSISSMRIADTSTLGQGVGGEIAFSGYYTGTTLISSWARIGGLKENTTDGNYAGYLSFDTRAQGGQTEEKMRITSNGNIGIGTTSPSSKLYVSTSESATSIKADGYIEDVSGILSKNYVSSHSWNIGVGTVGIFVRNGDESENSREWGVGPYGNRAILWKAVPDTVSGPDGGWNTHNITIDHTKSYRLSVWIKKTGSSDGTTYFGTRGVGGNLITMAGLEEANPYFWNGDLPQLDKWYLLVGYIHSSEDSSTTSYGGVYDGETGQKVISATDFKFQATISQIYHRSYLYYSTLQDSNQYWWDPRLEEVNGSEPSIEALLGIDKGATQDMVKYFGGNVGIGTTNPTLKLDVSGTFRNTLSTTHSLLGGAGNAVVMSDNTGALYSTGLSTFLSSNTLWSGTRNGNIWNGDAGVGNVGIGTTNPLRKLDVVGDIEIGSKIYGKATDWTYYQISDGDYNHRFYTRTSSGSALERLSIYGGTDVGKILMLNSNVGIGTTNPSYKLDVNGNINIDGSSAYKYATYDALKLATKGDTTDYSSTIIGRGAGDSLTDGTTIRQSAIGFFAGYLNTGANQTALGYYAGRENTGSSQTTLGYTAGYLNTGASQTAVGFFAGRENTGVYQSALGAYAGYQNAGDRVIGIGYEATRGNTATADDVVAIGYQAGKDNTVANQFIVKQANINVVPLIQGDFSSGNVGIGTASSTTKLDVSGTFRNTLSTTHSLLGGAGNAVVMSDNTGTLYSTSTDAFISSNSLGLWSGTKNGDIWNGDTGVGNVGIGTSSPSTNLEVAGDVLLNDALPRLTFYENDQTDKRFSIDVSGSFYIRSHNDNFSSYTSPFKIETGALDSTLVLRSTGKVGIGTANPGAALEINNPIANLRLKDSDTGNYVDINSSSTGYFDIIPSASAYGVVVRQSGNISSYGSLTAYNDYLRLKYNETTGLVINSSGNVGIGTTNPLGLLHLSIGEGLSFNHDGDYYATAQDARLIRIVDSNGTNGSADGGITIEGYTSTDDIARQLMTIRGSGMVGIGTITPAYYLDVAGTANFDGLAYGITPGTSQTYALTTVEYVDNAISGVNGSTVGYWTASGNNIYSANSANVGIGNTVPANKLDITGNFGVNGIFKGYGASNGNFFEGKLGVNSLSAGASSLAVFGNTSIGTAYLSTAAPTNGLLVQGNVGIGLTNPTAALHVANNVKIDGGLALTGNLSMASSTLIVDKITANTIDPLYTISGSKYSTFAPSIVGGVKEEYVGRIKEEDFSRVGSEYEAVIDFSGVTKGSDLWVWYQVVDFSSDNVEVFLTPNGKSASLYAYVENEKVVIRSDRAVDAYLRLIGKRYDWRKWPTKAYDQNQEGGLLVK